MSSLAKIRVLIVEDEKILQRLLRDILRKLGFEQIATASNGREAVRHILVNPVDFIITDWRMDDMNGLELLKFIRQAPESPCPRIPVIFLTGNTEISNVIEARDAGATEYMVKPFSASQLIRRVQALFEKPRHFIEAPRYRGHDRRRRAAPPPDGYEKRKRRAG